MTDCDICIGGDVDEIYAESGVIADKIAKRNLKCIECGSIINKGDLHEHAMGRDEYWGDADSQNHWDVYHTCFLCCEIRDVFACGQGFCYTTLWESMQEIAFPQLTTASKCFTKLSPKAKAFVMQCWRKWKGLAQ